jgi:ligand-binding sensor domain-containing protein
MRTKPTLLLACLFLFTTGTGMFAQTWTQYTNTNSPLPFPSVRCIAFESNGTAWIGTDFGLAKLAGGTWTVFNSSNSPLASNDIRSLYIGPDNKKYIGTFSAGLYLYNDTVWNNLNTGNSILPDDFIRSIHSGPANSLWIGTTAGLIRIDSAGAWSLYTMWNSVLGSNNIACLFHDTLSHELWAGTINGGALRVSNDTVLTSFTIQNSGISDNTILGIDRDPAGNILFVSPANGLIVKLNPFGWFTYNLVSSNIPTSGLTCVLADGLQDAWLGSFNKGLVRKTTSTFTFSDSTNSPLEDILVQCLARDSAGNIWIGTQTAGLYILDLQSPTGLPAEDFQLSGILAYPNPCTTALRLSGLNEETDIEIATPDGRIVQRTRTYSGILDVSTLPSGLLLIRPITGDWPALRIAHLSDHF